jgi:hypothetical protein
MGTTEQKLQLSSQIVLSCFNLFALVAFAFAPLAHVYPMAIIGIIAFTLVQLFLPACWI